MLRMPLSFTAPDMGLFAFRRLRELEAAANAAASFSIAEPTASADANTKPKRRGTVKRLSRPEDSGQAETD
jgi:hypothetical protein